MSVPAGPILFCVCISHRTLPGGATQVKSAEPPGREGVRAGTGRGGSMPNRAAAGRRGAESGPASVWLRHRSATPLTRNCQIRILCGLDAKRVSRPG